MKADNGVQYSTVQSKRDIAARSYRNVPACTKRRTSGSTSLSKYTRNGQNAEGNLTDQLPVHCEQLYRATKVVFVGISIIVFLELKHTLSKRELQIREGNTKCEIKDIKNRKFRDNKFVLHTPLHFRSCTTHTHKMRRATITRSNWLMILREMTVAYSENHNALCGQNCSLRHFSTCYILQPLCFKSQKHVTHTIHTI